MLPFWTALSTAAYLVQSPLRAPSDHSSGGTLISPALSDFIAATVAEWDVQGASVAVIKRTTDGWAVDLRGYGTADRMGSPVTPDTIMAIASNSKAFTVAALGLLVANESLPMEWTSKIADLLPGDDWVLQDKVAQRQANLRDIFSHRSGIPRHDLASPSIDETLQSRTRRLRHFKPSAGFRETWQYNNFMFDVGAYIVAHATKQPFADFATARLLRPLGLNSTTFDLPWAHSTGRLAEGFARCGENSTQAGERVAVDFSMGGEAAQGAGGILSTARDMAAWLQALLDGGRGAMNGAEVVPRAVLDAMSAGITVAKPVADYPEGAPVVYGMGFMRSAYRGHEYIEHGGADLGFTSQVARFPDDGVGIAVLTNDGSHGPLVHAIVKWAIADELFGLARVDWNTRLRAAYTKRLEKADEDKSARIPPSPRATLPRANATSLAGKYTNTGYGTLNLTAAPDKPLTLRAAPLSAVFGKLTFTFTHFAGERFNASTRIAMPTLNGTLVCDVDVVLDAEFGYDDAGAVHGVALWGGLWGAGADVPSPSGTTPEARAEVWFARD